MKIDLQGLFHCGRNDLTSPEHRRTNNTKLAYEDFDNRSYRQEYGLASKPSQCDYTSLRIEEKSKWSGDFEELEIPEGFIGTYDQFVLPHLWSSAFASPGDFTIKSAPVESMHRDNEPHYTFAIICSSIKSLTFTNNETKSKPVNLPIKRRKCSYIRYLAKSESDIIKFRDCVSLRFVGHSLSNRLILSFENTPDLQMKSFAFVEYLAYILSIRHVGANRLIQLTDPMAKNLIIRAFLDLPIGTEGGVLLTSTSSCDGRLELSREEQHRPLLPSSWFQSTECNEQDGADSGYPWRRIQSLRPQSYDRINSIPEETYKCINFVQPLAWNRDMHRDGAFTVELSSIMIHNDIALYKVSCLYNGKGRSNTNMIHSTRRFNEFHKLAMQIESKTNVKLSHYLPSKTFFRSISAKFLEERLHILQVFLEKLLSSTFVGMLGQVIQMAAEPSVREFLNLPTVTWNLVPNYAKTPIYVSKNLDKVLYNDKMESKNSDSPTLSMISISSPFVYEYEDIDYSYSQSKSNGGSYSKNQLSIFTSRAS